MGLCQWRSQELSMERSGGGAVGGHWGSGGEAPSARLFLQFFDKNNAFLCIFRSILFEAITQQLKEFEKQSKRTK